MLAFSAAEKRGFALRVRAMIRGWFLAAMATASLGCQHAPPVVAATAHVDAKAPPDDGGSSRGSAGGMQHAQALEALRNLPAQTVQSADGLVRMGLPAGANWRRVTFWGFDAYTGFRFGQDHHAIVGVTLFEPLRGEGDRGCLAAFDEWAKPYVEAFSLKLTGPEAALASISGHSSFVRRVYATGESPLGMVDYYAAYAIIPSTTDVCVVVGLAVPVREAGERGKWALDHLADEAFRTVRVDPKLAPRKP